MAEDKKTIEMSQSAKREEEILAFWNEKGIFEKSLKKDSPKGEFVFYDGPPFATGLPHYGHILAGTIKDVIPRFKTMQGYHVRRRWGWDCHGLPIENIVEKELGLKTKKDIENFGIEKFNESARKGVMRFADDWKKLIPRFGRWVDMNDDYRTMDSSYTESVWWAFKNLHDKGLIYEGFKPMHICPRCETTLSNFEVGQGYKDITDISVYAKFQITNNKSQINSKFQFPKGENDGKTYLIAWTTTPWTLTGNVALAVGKDILYSKIQNVKIKNQNDNAKLKNENAKESYIVARERLEKVFKDYTYEVVDEFIGEKLVGLSYEPIFDYYSGDLKLKNRENGWKVYSGDFITTTDGSGIVHIAPAFGEDDMNLGKKMNLPFVVPVKMDGTYKDEVSDFSGLHVKPKDDVATKTDHQSTDILIIKNLASRGLLFGKEKIIHPYPHCWRCDTPLLNYASSSWFVKVTDFKDKLIRENKKVKWVPEEVGEGRFGKWLEGARDWAISRTRFWGAPIPVWKCENCEEVKVLQNADSIKSSGRNRNNYFVMRHGEASTNTDGIISSRPLEPHHLTDRGRAQVKASVAELESKKIDLIFHSPFIRTKETTEIVISGLGFNSASVFEDKRLEEIKAGIFDGKNISEYRSFFSSEEERFTKAPLGGEDFNMTKKRLGDFLYDIDSRFEGKNILIITHESPAWLLLSVAKAFGPAQACLPENHFYLQNAEIKEFYFAPLPHNENYEFDLHRPYIDGVNFKCGKCSNVMKRVPDVFDCWFESGSMPYAESCYPSSKAEFNPESGIFKKSKGFPADFVAEGLDQTRGWFYSSMVLSTALFGKSPFKQVVVNGTILAEDGQKMSKRLKNYPDPVDLVHKFGADAMRLYLLSSPAVKGQDLRFSEKGVDEVSKKVLGRLDNVLSFYRLYLDKNRTGFSVNKSTNILDEWILLKMSELEMLITKSLEVYELDKAVRPIFDFVDDLSTWYLRRSRDRFKSDDFIDKNFALDTTAEVLRRLAVIIAPFAPFFAEYLYGEIIGYEKDKKNESVHLEKWPNILAKLSEDSLSDLEEMREVRRIVSLALEARAKAGIKVRQPLAKLKVKSEMLKDGDLELLGLIRDEVNVREVTVDQDLKEEIILDMNITADLKEEGQVRELIRAIQEARKIKCFTISDSLTLTIDANEAGRKLIEKNTALITKTALIKRVVFETVADETYKIDDLEFRFSLQK